jgi:hypothetical protein
MVNYQLTPISSPFLKLYYIFLNILLCVTLSHNPMLLYIILDFKKYFKKFHYRLLYNILPLCYHILGYLKLFYSKHFKT